MCLQIVVTRWFVFFNKIEVGIIFDLLHVLSFKPSPKLCTRNVNAIRNSNNSIYHHSIKHQVLNFMSKISQVPLDTKNSTNYRRYRLWLKMLKSLLRCGSVISLCRFPFYFQKIQLTASILQNSPPYRKFNFNSKIPLACTNIFSSG